MPKIKFINLVVCSFIFLLCNSNAYASSFIKIQVNDLISFQLPKNWIVLSDNKTITLNSIIESSLSVSSKVTFQANLKNDLGVPITTVQIYKWRTDVLQKHIYEMSNDQVVSYDQAMHDQIKKELKKIEGSVTDWQGTRKLNINGLLTLASEYSRLSNTIPFGRFRVQVLRVYSGYESFSFVISYYEESPLPLRILVAKVISTLQCTRCR